MGENNITEPPTASTWDRAHSSAKAVLSIVPGLGGAAAEVFAAVVTPPLEKRRDEWVERIAEVVKELRERVDDFSIEAISQNEVFITTMLHASHAAIRNHQEEKLQALRNAVLNSALPGAPSEDLQLMFVRYIDELTPWHLAALKYFDDPERWCQQHHVRLGNSIAASVFDTLGKAIPGLGANEALREQVITDLDNRSLTKAAPGMWTTVTPKGALAPKTTDMGKQLLKFILSPTEEIGSKP